MQKLLHSIIRIHIFTHLLKQPVPPISCTAPPPITNPSQTPFLLSPLLLANHFLVLFCHPIYLYPSLPTTILYIYPSPYLLIHYTSVYSNPDLPTPIYQRLHIPTNHLRVLPSISPPPSPTYPYPISSSPPYAYP